MIRYRLRELMADKSFREGSSVTIGDIAQTTGISRRVLSSLINERGYNTGTDNVDRLCQYFDCSVQDVMQYVKEPAAAETTGTQPGKRSRKG